MAAIEILGLEKTYMVGFWRKRPKRALQPLHLTVEEGEIFGFLGPNGAGKTTTLKMLMGLVFPTAGTARILGHEWTDPEVKAQIGFLPEQPYSIRIRQSEMGRPPKGLRMGAPPSQTERATLCG